MVRRKYWLKKVNKKGDSDEEKEKDGEKDKERGKEDKGKKD